MKTHTIAIVTAVLATLAQIHAGEGHHHEKKVAGPNGGRLLTTMDPHAEFVVTADRKVQITFIGEDGKVIAPSGQVVKVTTGSRSAPVKMTFQPAGTSIVSDQAVPEGNNFPVVVQIQAGTDAKVVTEKFMLNLTKCPGCQLAEYACICDHTH